jgi:heme-degrading monooxygenase HmoA
MHAVVVRVRINDPERSEETLRNEVVPGVSQAPGFQAGYWTRDGDEGLSMVIFDSEANARAGAERVPSMAPQEVTVQSVDVREVVASA